MMQTKDQLVECFHIYFELLSQNPHKWSLAVSQHDIGG